MRSSASPLDRASVEVVVPRQPGRLPGVGMAGFRQGAPANLSIAMVAHPSVTLFVDLSDGNGLVHDADGRRERGSTVVGLAPGGLRLGGGAAGGIECLQIRLSPVLAVAVFGASADLSGTVVSWEDVWGRDAGRTEERLRAAASWDERFTIAADALGRRAGAGPSLDPEVTAAWWLMRTSRGRVRVDSLASEVGWSRKRLWSRFRSQIGLTPKHAARLVRFDHAVRLLAAGNAAARVAAESGYVDQAHLHREVKAFTGVTPTAVAAAPWLAIDDVAWPGSLADPAPFAAPAPPTSPVRRVPAR
ncbi:helix-turn-helix domain-containing protein [Streptomyces roseicoloratus]|uniref:Helix-turn-helix domain-containing protein n=1 Tax=Streptomyces roseicoloratus TaxID=2508722 RepID=A0ABY9S4Y6_9ACTN|nr:helix-turn-helix domain-containing protein [Streptomyces roseicoloratus]WMX48464.1 helix-turn-helix domain-containing protein [Streptomyces roseicoloratus]